MRLLSLEIERFKNLRDIALEFDPLSPYTVLVGENGAGKSNLIEAITQIFRNLDLDLPAPFTYRLIYQCRDHDVKVDGSVGSPPTFSVRDQGGDSFSRLTKRAFMSEDLTGRPLYRPAFVFGYYSGPSDRLAELYDRHRERFYRQIIRAQTDTDGVSSNAYRRLFYAQTLHGQFALLAFFMESDPTSGDDRAFLREYLQIEGLDSVLFALRQPPWPPHEGGDPRFWNADGEVRQFLARLYDAALLPMRMPRRIQVDLRRNPSVDSLYLFLPNQEALDRVYRTYPDQYAFFTALESTHLSKLLGEVRARVVVTPSAGGGALTYRDLSEGEQQLLLVLGLLKFTARDEALFLLDEPDTHLNPIWSTQYLDFLDRFIQMRSRGDSCHILMSTHDPLVFSGLVRSQVRIFRRRKDGNVVTEIPDEDPRGMGVAAILTSDLFRLRSTLDRPTQLKLDRMRVLAGGPMTDDDLAELRELGSELEARGFARTTRDPLYELFIKAWTQAEDPAWRTEVALTDEQRHARAVLADQIVERLRIDLETDNEIH
jgi:predicted ATPase